MPAVLLVAKHLSYKLGLFNPASPVSWWAIVKSVKTDLHSAHPTKLGLWASYHLSRTCLRVLIPLEGWRAALPAVNALSRIQQLALT